MKKTRDAGDAENDDVIFEVDLHDRRRLQYTIEWMAEEGRGSRRDFVAIDKRGSVAEDRRLSESWRASSDVLGSGS